jgi:hypothetical protein
LSIHNHVDFARHLCGFKEQQLKAASGTLHWNKQTTKSQDQSTDLFELIAYGNPPLRPDKDDYRCILINGVRERPKGKTEEKDWKPSRLNGMRLPIGFPKKEEAKESARESAKASVSSPASEDRRMKDGVEFFLRTMGPTETCDYDFEKATWVLPFGSFGSDIHPPHEYDAQAVVWKLRRGLTNMYAIRPSGDFSEAAYGELIDFLLGQEGYDRSGLDIYYYDSPDGRQYWTADWDPGYNIPGGAPPNYQAHNEKILPTKLGRNLEKSERVSMPGVTGGRATLLNGEVLTEIIPNMRGTHSWSLDRIHHEMEDAVKVGHDPNEGMCCFEDLLQHLDEIVRNRGISAQERALNYAATHVVNILPEVVRKNTDYSTFELDAILAPVRSSIGPPGSDCWEVAISFFDPKSIQSARLVYSQAIDVSDVIPYRVEAPKQYRKR